MPLLINEVPRNEFRTRDSVISPRNFRPLRRPRRRREGDGGELAVRGRAGGSLRLQREEEA